MVGQCRSQRHGWGSLDHSDMVGQVHWGKTIHADGSAKIAFVDSCVWPKLRGKVKLNDGVDMSIDLRINMYV